MSTRYRLGLSLLSGLLLGLSLPMQWGHWQPPNLGFLAWVALVPLILATRGLRPGRAYCTAFLGMLLGHGIMVYWFYTAVHVYGHLGVVTSLFVTLAGLVFLAAITSLAPTLVAWIEKDKSTWWAWPLAWAAIEFGRNFDPFLNGFTFCNLIHSQYRYPLLFQIVNVVGPYWFLAAMVFVNVSVARMLPPLPTRQSASGGGEGRLSAGRLAEGEGEAQVSTPLSLTLPQGGRGVVCLLSIFVLLLSYGLYSRAQLRDESRHWPWLRVALIQGNIPQDAKWEKAFEIRNFKVHQQATVQAALSHPDLVVWPEASYPWTLELDDPQLSSAQAIPAVPLLLGAITRSGLGYHNSAVLLDEGHQVRDVVHKYHLVPFGEYVPYKNILSFARALTAAAGDLLPADGLRPLHLDGMPLGVLVCYEDTFPEIARSLVAQGSVLLINITNDAWYGWSSAAEQHLAASVFRAAENGRSLLRATNTGVSAVIGPDGGLQLASSLYEPAVIVTGVRLGMGRTLYNRYGAILDPILPTALLMGWIATRIQRRKKYPPQ